MQQIYLHIVFYSELNEKNNGLYQTIQHDSYAPLALCYAIDDGEVKIIDLMEEKRLPPKVVCAVLNPKIVKYAHNAEATWVQLTKILKRQFDYKGWRDISKFLKYLRIEEEVSRVSEYEQFFCHPQRFGKITVRNNPLDFPVKWKQYRDNMKYYIDMIFENEREYACYMKESVWKFQKYMVQVHSNKLVVEPEKLVFANRKEKAEFLSTLREVARILNLKSEMDYRELSAVINGGLAEKEEKTILKKCAESIGWNRAKIKYYQYKMSCEYVMRFSNLMNKCRCTGVLQGCDYSDEMILFLLENATFQSKEMKRYLCSYQNLEIAIVSWLGNEQQLQSARIDFGKQDNSMDKDIYKACLYGGGKTNLEFLRTGKQNNGNLSWNRMVMEWRSNNKEIVSLWGLLFRACCYCLLFQTSLEAGKVKLSYIKGNLQIKLPSERNIILLDCRIDKDEQGENKIWYKESKMGKKQNRQYLDGGKLCRIITSFVQQDIIEELFLMLMDKEFHVIAVGNNYIAIEEEQNALKENELHNVLRTLPRWCKGLNLTENIQCIGKEQNEDRTLQEVDR